jgi:hypothetical protein
MVGARSFSQLSLMSQDRNSTRSQHQVPFLLPPRKHAILHAATRGYAPSRTGGRKR